MVIERIIWIVLVLAVVAGGYFFGHLQGRKYAGAQFWAVGYDAGYSAGIGDAALAYDSGGIVDVTTGKVTKKKP